QRERLFFVLLFFFLLFLFLLGRISDCCSEQTGAQGQRHHPHKPSAKSEPGRVHRVLLQFLLLRNQKVPFGGRPPAPPSPPRASFVRRESGKSVSQTVFFDNRGSCVWALLHTTSSAC